MTKSVEYRLSMSPDGFRPILVNRNGEELANTTSINVNWSHNDITEVTVTLFVMSGGDWPDGQKS